MGSIRVSSCSFFVVYPVLVLCSSLLIVPEFLGNDTDRLALLEFKSKITHDPLGVLSSWNESMHFCQWHGVTCSRRHQRITVLDLHSLELVGSISPYIGNLSFLKKLHLNNNSFHHKIPSEIGRLRRLEELLLYKNSIVGEIPTNISRCTNLIEISLAVNELVGKIPSELGSLPKIEFLSLDVNHVTGTIPSSFGNLSSINTISLAYNNLVGSIPDNLSRLKNLTDLALGANRLTGNIPSSIFNISSMASLDVGQNQIKGNIPLDFGFTLPNIRQFSIATNQITGVLPPSLSNASKLEEFYATENNLTGKVPHLENLQMLSWFILTSNHLGSGGHDDLNFLCSLTNATRFQKLYININNFGGKLPRCIGNLSTTLHEFVLHDNNISGTIPHEIGNFVNLLRLEMWNNQFSGNIPPTIGELQNLGIFRVGGNGLSGNIPLSIGNMKKLFMLYLDNNFLEGNIPSSLGQCKSLVEIALFNNNLNGTIPAQLIALSSLSIVLDLSRNQLTGSLPTEVGNLKKLGNLNVSWNSLSGDIPSSLGSCTSLEILDMNNNFFQGSIPSSLVSLRGLSILDLSQNNISGQIPSFLSEFKLLQNLNLSYNDLEGMVPNKGVFKNTSSTSVVGNIKLCGGMPEFQLPTCSSGKSSQMRLTLAKKLAIAIFSGLLGLALALSFLFVCWVKKRKESHNPSSSINSINNLSYQNLYNATNGFSSDNMIGAGSFGSVYKGILEEGKTIIAVKVFHLLHYRAFKSFIVECKALRNIRHRNIVKVLTACSGMDYEGNDFKALVYEFMPNGSLEEWLHPVTGEDGIHEMPRNLNLLQRVNIAIDIACALNYLHHDCRPPIAHCDLKPSNVLLDDKLTAHVGDFGLSRFLLFDHKQTSSIGLKGSIGYIAPEYGLGSQVSTNGDIYSYGILLLELVTGKKPTNVMFEGDWNLHSFVRMALPDHVMDIVDPILIDNDEELVGNNDIKTKCLISLVRIGVVCSMESPQDRMNIINIVSELQSIKNILLEHGAVLNMERGRG